MYFVAIVDGQGKTWGARVPDFPGCFGGGATPEEAVADVTSALREMAERLVARGKRLPKPRPMAEIFEEIRRGREKAYPVLVPLLIDSGRPTRANISVDAGLLAVIDVEAKMRGQTRSSFLASAARDKIAASAGMPDPTDPEKQARKLAAWLLEQVGEKEVT